MSPPGDFSDDSDSDSEFAFCVPRRDTPVEEADDNALSDLLGVAVKTKTKTTRAKGKDENVAAQMSVEQALARIKLHTVAQVEDFLMNLNGALQHPGKSSAWCRLLTGIWSEVYDKLDTADIKALRNKMSAEVSQREKRAQAISHRRVDTQITNVRGGATAEELLAQLEG